MAYKMTAEEIQQRETQRQEMQAKANASHAEKIRTYAARGRAWIVTQAAETKAALARYGQMGKHEDGTHASLSADLADFRAAWRLTK